MKKLVRFNFFTMTETDVISLLLSFAKVLTCLLLCYGFYDKVFLFSRSRRVGLIRAWRTTSLHENSKF